MRLELVAWPKAKVRVGQKVHLQVIGTAKSTSTGFYTIHPTVALPKGIHNLEVLARSSKAVGAFSFARKIAGRGRALAVDGNWSAGPVRANIHMMALPKSALPAVPHPGVPCIITRKVREFGPRMVDVGGLYSFVTDAAMKMTYMAGASTTMGVAISIPFPGEVGSFSAEGTFTETASGKEPFPVEHDQADVNMQTPYTYGEYSFCGFMNQVQPEVWVTGDREVKVNPPVTDPPDKCSHHYSPRHRPHQEHRDSRHVQGRRQPDERDRHQLVGSIRIH